MGRIVSDDGPMPRIEMESPAPPTTPLELLATLDPIEYDFEPIVDLPPDAVDF